MSMHSSLKGAAKIRTKRNVRNVLSARSLKKDGRWRSDRVRFAQNQTED